MQRMICMLKGRMMRADDLRKIHLSLSLVRGSLLRAACVATRHEAVVCRARTFRRASKPLCRRLTSRRRRLQISSLFHPLPLLLPPPALPCSLARLIFRHSGATHSVNSPDQRRFSPLFTFPPFSLPPPPLARHGARNRSRLRSIQTLPSEVFERRRGQEIKHIRIKCTRAARIQ